MANKFLYRVGVDPAWKNLGLAIVKEEVETGELHLVHSCVMDPSKSSSISKFVETLNDEIYHAVYEDLFQNEDLLQEEGDEEMEFDVKISSVTIERFVAYAGVSTAETENICMIIGALQYMFASPYTWNTESLMLRAIDWKTTLVKELYKQKGFDNPSTKLDKKFSIAAAKACLDHEHKFATDHEADATCLASYPSIIIKGKVKK